MVMERATRQRDAIKAATLAAGRPLSAEEVLGVARTTIKTLAISTVYRTLKLLVEDGTLRVINLPGQNPRYEMAGIDHHHHFQCSDCGRVYDLAGCPGELHRLAPRGFTVDHHDLTLYGRCSDCGKRKANSRDRTRAARG